MKYYKRIHISECKSGYITDKMALTFYSMSVTAGAWDKAFTNTSFMINVSYKLHHIS